MLKCICSGFFAVLGLFNLFYAIKTKAQRLNFYVLMALGLVFAMLEMCLLLSILVPVLPLLRLGTSFL
ncbi:MAG: hypothetical protein IJW37_09820 [Lachnospiraceae bacterium]|nr:hypothetical protein [Lachnospiraceae bacterium]